MRVFRFLGGCSALGRGFHTREGHAPASPSGKSVILACCLQRSHTDIDTSYLVLPLATSGVSFLRTLRDVHT